jgi:hypothetical protein
MKIFFLATVISFCLASCATILTSGKAFVTMDAKNVDGTTVLVNGLERGTTPLTLKLKTDDMITFEKEGYESRTVIVDGKFNTVAILNLFSILGWGVNVITNSIQVPDTRVYQVTLKEK